MVRLLARMSSQVSCQIGRSGKVFAAILASVALGIQIPLLLGWRRNWRACRRGARCVGIQIGCWRAKGMSQVVAEVLVVLAQRVPLMMVVADG